MSGKSQDIADATRSEDMAHKVWKRLVDDDVVVINNNLVYAPGGDYLVTSGITNKYDELHAMERVAVVLSIASEDDAYRETPNCASDVEEILETFGLIPKDVTNVISLTVSHYGKSGRFELTELPFNWNTAILLYRTGGGDGAVFCKDDIKRVADQSILECSFDDPMAPIIDKYTYGGNISQDMWKALGRMYVSRSAYRTAWLYANITVQYDEKWRGGWSAEYLAQAVKAFSAGKLVLNPNDLRGGRDAYIRSEYQTIIYEDQIKEHTPRLYELGKLIDDVYWMFYQETNGLSAKGGKMGMEEIEEYLFEVGFDKKVEALVSCKLPPVDIMAGSVQQFKDPIGENLMQYKQSTKRR